MTEVSQVFPPAVAALAIAIVSAYLWHMLPWTPRKPMASRISDRIFNLCNDSKSVSSEYAKETSKSPGQHAELLYGKEAPAITEQKGPRDRQPASKEDLERARQCGKWGDTRPSELFLQCYHAALCSLEHDRLAGMVSPSLMGSNGVIPLSIVAPLPDICRHMSNLIARAETEVFLATNFWIKSNASRLITDSLLELSKRAGERGKKVVVKVMYDRGNAKQIIDNHQIMTVEQYTGDAVKLPGPKDIPNIDLQVQNYHRPALGTFHAKYMVVDRKIAIVQSNNIQDNDNLEMMTHLEGPIVDSFYDTALLSWYAQLTPPLPLIGTPGKSSVTSTFDDPKFQAMFRQGNERISLNQIALEGEENADLPLHAAGDPHYDPDLPSEIRRLQHVFAAGHGESRMDAVTRHLNRATNIDHKATAPACKPEDDMVPLVPHRPHAPFPIALVNRRPWGAPNHQCVTVPQNEAWLAAIRNATSSIFIQSPDVNASPLMPALKEALERGVEVTYYVCLGYNDAGELLPFQGGTNEMAANKLYESLFDDAKKRLHVHYYVAKDQNLPVHNKFKARSCHIKLMIVDGHLGIQGNGNQDTQSWFHSMEVNIMIDSETVCGDWLEAIRRNQNTQEYGKASQEDGIWRDADGNEAKGAIGKDPGRFAWAKGIYGAIQRVRGVEGLLA